MPIEPTDDRATTKYPPPMNVGQGSAYGTLHRHAATGPIGSRSGDPQPIEKEPGWSSLQVPSRPPIPPRCSRPWPRTYLRVAARPSAVRVRLRPIVCRERAMSVVDCVSRTLSGSAPRHSHQTCCHQDQACVTDPQRAKEPPVRKIIDGQQHHTPMTMRNQITTTVMNPVFSALRFASVMCLGSTVATLAGRNQLGHHAVALAFGPVVAEPELFVHAPGGVVEE